MDDILQAFSPLTEDVVLYLPRTSNLRQMVKYVPSNRKMTIIHYCMEGASKVHHLLSLPRSEADLTFS